jgi:hypothetical protein
MRTGIYVYNSTTLTIQGSEDLGITSFDGTTNLTVSKSATVAVAPGIYRIVSVAGVTVTGSEIDVITMEDKDPWPDPPLAVTQKFDVTVSAVSAFFTVARTMTL